MFCFEALFDICVIEWTIDHASAPYGQGVLRCERLDIVLHVPRPALVEVCVARVVGVSGLQIGLHTEHPASVAHRQNFSFGRQMVDVGDS